MTTVDLLAQCANGIIRGANWKQVFQLGLNDGRRAIQSSTAANPIAVTLTDLQQSFADSSRVVIAGHDNEPCNNTDANPSWVVTSSSNNVFSLTSVAGINGVLGTNTGYAWQAIDATGWTAYIMLFSDASQVLPVAMWTNLGVPVPNPFLDIYKWNSKVVMGTFAWIGQTALRFSIALTHAQTAALFITSGSLYGKCFFTDASGNPMMEFAFTVPVGNG